MEGHQLCTRQRRFGRCVDERQKRGERRPRERVIHRPQCVGDQRGVGERNRLPGDRIDDDVRRRPEARREGREPARGVPRERTIRPAGVAEAKELVECRARASIAAKPSGEWEVTLSWRTGRPGDRIEDAIDHQRTESVWK